jgi:hypothetical protein
MKLGFIYIIQRPKINPRNGESGSPHPEEFKTQKSSSKVLAPVFWDKYGKFPCRLHATITANYYVALLDKLKQQLVFKLRGKLSRGVLLSSRQCCSSQSGHYAQEIGRSSL